MAKVIDYYKELFKEFKEAGKLPKLLIFHGEEDYLMERGVERISESLKASIFLIDGSEKNIKEVVEREIHTGLFVPKKLIVIKRAEKIKSLNDVLSMLERTEHRVILIFKDAKKVNNLKKSLKGVRFVEFPPMDMASLETWVRTRLKKQGIDIDKDTLQRLCAKLPHNLSMAQKELDKIMLYIDGRDHITEEDLEVIFEEELADFKGLLWRIFTGEGYSVFRDYIVLREKGFYPHAFIAETEQFLTSLFLAKEDAQEVYKRKFRFKRAFSKSKTIAERFSERDLLLLLDWVVNLDAYTKSVAFDKKVILDTLFVKLIENA